MLLWLNGSPAETCPAAPMTPRPPQFFASCAAARATMQGSMRAWMPAWPPPLAHRAAALPWAGGSKPQSQLQGHVSKRRGGDRSDRGTYSSRAVVRMDVERAGEALSATALQMPYAANAAQGSDTKRPSTTPMHKCMRKHFFAPHTPSLTRSVREFPGVSSSKAASHRYWAAWFTCIICAG